MSIQTVISSAALSLLSSQEQIVLREAEGKIQAAADNIKQAYYILGTEFLRIREGKLYRAEFGTFEDYCSKRWGYTYNYVYKLVAATDVRNNLEMCTMVHILDENDEVNVSPNLPENERVARPLVGLSPDEQRAAWEDAKVKASEAGLKTPNYKIAAAAAAPFKNQRVEQLAAEEGGGERLLHNLVVAREEQTLLNFADDTEESPRPVAAESYTDERLDAATALPTVPVAASLPIAQLVKSAEPQSAPANGTAVPRLRWEKRHHATYEYRNYLKKQCVATVQIAEKPTDSGTIRYEIEIDGRYFDSSRVSLAHAQNMVETHIAKEIAANSAGEGNQ